MSAAVVPLVRAMRARSAAAVAGLMGRAAGLDEIEVEAVQRHVRNRVTHGGASAARALEETRRQMAAMKREKGHA